MTGERIYPLPRLNHDARFTLGLMLDVRLILIDHGYPTPEHGHDLVDLQMALFGFLYGPAEAR